MTRALACSALLVLVLVVLDVSRGSAHDARAASSSPPPLLPMLPSVAKVRLEVARAHVVVVEEVNLPRGAYVSGPFDLYVAFAAPGAPLAIDAHLLPVRDGALEADSSETGASLAVSRAAHRPEATYPLLGASTMAGIVVHVPESELLHALAPGGMAALRVRSVVLLPEEAADGGREVLVRLGAAGHTPLTLGYVQIATHDAPPLARAEAHLCGPEAEAYPLAIAGFAAGAAPHASDAGAPTIAPVLAVRHASDDLCVRFWRR